MQARLTLIIGLLSLSAPAASAEKITYDDHIYPVFESKCLNCHNPDKKKGDLDLSTYTGVLAGSSGGKIALAGDGVSSKLYTVTVHTEEPVMPPEGDKIDKKSADLIRAWIDGGLLENSGSKAKKPKKPAFSLGAIPTGKRPDGPPPMPKDLLLEPVITTHRATVVADMDASPWAPLLAVTGQRQVLLYHSDSLELVGILPFPLGNPETVSFHPSGKYLLAGGGIAGKSGTTVTWDVTTGKVMMTMGKEFDSILAADLRADLGGVALGGPSRLVKLWDTQEVEQLASIKKHTDWLTALAYSPDGVLLATGDRNSGVQIWEAATGNEFHALRGHKAAIVDVKWRADSNLIATASEDGTIQFWDMNRGNSIKTAKADPTAVLAMDYAANGRLISAGRDRRVKLWKPNLGIEKQTSPFPDLITEVAFSHNTQRFFTADWTGKIEVWNSKTLKKIGELDSTPPSIESRLAAFGRKQTELEVNVNNHKAKAQAAAKSLQDGYASVKNNETTIATLKKRQQDLQKAIPGFDRKWRELEGEAKKKFEEKARLAKKGKTPQQQKVALMAKRRTLAAGQQKLSQELSTAKQQLIIKQRDTEAKRAAANKDVNNAEKKAALAAAEKAEQQQSVVVAKIQPKLKQQKKLIADLAAQMKTLDSGGSIASDDTRVAKLAEQHAELITRRNQVAKKKQDALARITAAKKKLPALEKQIAPLKKQVQTREKAAKLAKDALTKAQATLTTHPASLKKWQAALINTKVIKARQKLKELTAQTDPPPNLAKQQKLYETLLAQYQAAK